MRFGLGKPAPQQNYVHRSIHWTTVVGSRLYLDVKNLIDLDAPYASNAASVFDTLGHTYTFELRVEI